MNIVTKLTYSASIIIAGILISSVVKDMVGVGQFIVLGITVVVVFMI